MLKITMKTPERAEELNLAQRTMTKEAPETLLASGAVQAVINAEDLQELREQLSLIVVRDELLAYLVDIVRATRQHESVLVGAGPRATQSLIMGSGHAALLRSRFRDSRRYQVHGLAGSGARLILRPEFEIEGLRWQK